MKTSSAILITFLCLGQQRPPSTVLEDIGRLVDEYRASLPPPIVTTSGELKAALTAGGTVRLAENAVYTGPFGVNANGTRILGAPGAWLAGVGGPALVVHASDLQVSDITATATGTDWAVIRLGENDQTQTTLEQEPSGIILTNIHIPTFRGKRGIEVNARNVQILNAEILDVWHPNANDSQAVGVLNSSGKIQILGGHFQAGSEVIMVGGDTIKLAGVQTTGILIEGADLERPLSWQTDGVNRGVKNVLEFKAGIDVIVRRTTLRGCWIAGQTGVALTITARDKRVVDNLLFEDVTIADVASGIQMVGRDYTSFTDGALHVKFVRLTVTTDKKKFGTATTVGRGLLAEISAEPASVVFEDVTSFADGDAILMVYQGQVMNEDGTKRAGGPVGSLSMTNSRARRGANGMFLNGYANGGVNGEGKAAATVLDISGNTFGGDTSASVMKKNFPLNTYLTRAAFDLSVGVSAGM